MRFLQARFIADEILSAQARDVPHDAALHKLDLLFQGGIVRFPQSALLHVFYAAYVRACRKNPHLEMQQLMQATQKDPALDVAFFIHQRKQQEEENAMSDSSVRMSILQKLSFEKHRQAATRYGIEARQRQLAFWTELLAKQPDIGRLHQIGAEINEATTKAESSFTQLLRLNRQSVTVLREYGQFLIHVLNYEAKAEQYLTEADAIEAAETRAQRERQSNSLMIFSADVHLPMSSESLGLLMVSDANDTFGKVTSVNTAALRAFGYSQQGLVGQPLSSLLPPPIDELHDLFMRRYLQTGKEVMVRGSQAG